MGSDGEDVGDARSLPESDTTRRLRLAEADIERMERDVSALRADLLRVGTDAAEERRHIDGRIDEVGREIRASEGRILAILGRRNEILARLCEHTMRLAGALGDAPVRVLAEVRQSALLSAGFAVLVIAGAAWMLGLDLAEIMLGEHYGVSFAPKLP